MLQALQDWLARVFRGDPAALAVVAELVIIAAAVYGILRFLSGTRGASLFRGVALLLLSGTLVVKLVAERFGLDRLLAVYPSFVIGVSLMGLVVFQPELRRALMRLGAAGWLPGLTRGVNAVLDEIIESVSYLSRNKVGALIAIERNTELATIVAAGCRLDAEVTAPLLNTIFWPGSALHDMGVVISQGRISAAACLFPLTESTSLSATLGSRHRAAVGLSEESDALVVVVSEETGVISLAEHGRLYRPLTPEGLREMLEERLGGEAPPVEEAPAPVAEPPPMSLPARGSGPEMDRKAGDDRARSIA